MGAEIRAQGAREAAKQAARGADRAEAEAWSIRMVGRHSRRRQSGNVSTVGSAGSKLSAIAARPERAYRWTLSAGRATRPLWNLEASLKCRSCGKGRFAPSVHIIKLTEQREISPYKWVHPDEDR